MKRYTVVLQTPDYLAEQYGEDHSIMLVESGYVQRAVTIAQGLAAINHKNDPEDTADPEDFLVIAVFEGWHENQKRLLED